MPNCPKFKLLTSFSHYFCSNLIKVKQTVYRFNIFATAILSQCTRISGLSSVTVSANKKLSCFWKCSADMKSLLLLLNFIIEYSQAKMSIRMNPRSVQSTVYDDMRENKQLSGTWNKTINVDCQNGCAMSCIRNPKCRSFTFCGRSTCFLHSDDVFSTAEGEAILWFASDCEYFGMKKHDFPICKEGDNFINIQQDNHKVLSD